MPSAFLLHCGTLELQLNILYPLKPAPFYLTETLKPSSNIPNLCAIWLIHILSSILQLEGIPTCLRGVVLDLLYQRPAYQSGIDRSPPETKPEDKSQTIGIPVVSERAPHDSSSGIQGLRNCRWAPLGLSLTVRGMGRVQGYSSTGK